MEILNQSNKIIVKLFEFPTNLIDFNSFEYEISKTYKLSGTIQGKSNDRFSYTATTILIMDFGVKIPGYYISNEYEVLKYTEGCFFTIHKDKKRKSKIVDGELKEHAASVLIYPPKSKYNYKGGIFMTSDANVEADDEYWTVVFMPLGIRHSVSPVERGVRYAIKGFAYKL